MKFKATYLDDQLDYGLGSNSSGYLSLKLLPGAVYDSYKMRIFIQIYDNDGAFTIYQINNSIIVKPDVSNLATLINQLISMDKNANINAILSQGSTLLTIQQIIGVSALLNEESLSDKFGLIQNSSKVLST